MAQQPPTEMRRWQIPAPGSFIKDLTLTTVPTPSATTLTPTQVLVQVVAAGINPADYKLPDLGLVAKAMVSFPRCPGMDFSGRAVAVGSEITDIAPGDLVVGRVNPLGTHGSLSEYLVADRDGIAAFPHDPAAAAAAAESLEQAGAVGTAALTAYQTIAPYVKAGDHVFINGGSGGTGTFGIQIAKALGCAVTVSCSTAKEALCKSLGADEIIDYKTSDVVSVLRSKGKVFSVVVDNVGNSPPNLYKASDDFLLAGGHFKFVGGAVSLAQVSSLVPSLFLPGFLGGAKHKFETFMTKNVHADLAQIAAWMAEGKVRTVVDSTYEFEDAVKAYEKLKEGSAAGKIVVRVAKKA
ncbi:zinc-binding dehydrogenase [Colletotrichum orchidophilum]|uniref:Zinc-binding dehydrogenase n=1 Tax=Colletotrichum orchidophilum TaxID=1209926 RepID=A0A1G4BA11_9PEZI|nr:zinc-binding dehydrogenase [Colletotrichum orchidophilum]OHE98165.1 zinc-binding dehydrogenase [Colletotrichum orchidophilum]